jgi:hypothetical protein
MGGGDLSDTDIVGGMVGGLDQIREEATGKGDTDILVHADLHVDTRLLGGQACPISEEFLAGEV